MKRKNLSPLDDMMLILKSMLNRGMSLVDIYKQIKSLYTPSEAQAIFHEFLKRYVKNNPVLMKEFNSSCFIENSNPAKN